MCKENLYICQTVKVATSADQQTKMILAERSYRLCYRKLCANDFSISLISALSLPSSQTTIEDCTKPDSKRQHHLVPFAIAFYVT